jgi:hypothetical protein
MRMKQERLSYKLFKYQDRGNEEGCAAKKKCDRL